MVIYAAWSATLLLSYYVYAYIMKDIVVSRICIINNIFALGMIVRYKTLVTHKYTLNIINVKLIE